MKFTNERISNADREKYQAMGINFGIARYWAINQDRDIFVNKTVNYREEPPDFPPYKFNDWLYFYKGEVMEFSSCIYLRNDGKYKEDTFILRYIISSTIPEDKKEECFSLLKEALRIHGRYGFPSQTEPTDFIFEF
jgi:hypothetical protein